MHQINISVNFVFELSIFGIIKKMDIQWNCQAQIAPQSFQLAKRFAVLMC